MGALCALLSVRNGLESISEHLDPKSFLGPSFQVFPLLPLPSLIVILQIEKKILFPPVLKFFLIMDRNIKLIFVNYWIHVCSFTIIENVMQHFY